MRIVEFGRKNVMAAFLLPSLLLENVRGPGARPCAGHLHLSWFLADARKNDLQGAKRIG